jgi:hypothetical protein
VTDGLTGLFNHAYFIQALRREVLRARRHDLKLSLAMFDLDDFKQVNDTRGQPEGDRILMKTAEVIRDSLREIDTAARYGGDLGRCRHLPRGCHQPRGPAAPRGRGPLPLQGRRQEPDHDGGRREARAKNVSEGGLLVSLREVPVGSNVTLVIRPSDAPSMALRGVVVRLEKAGHDGGRPYEIASAEALTVLRRVGAAQA